MGGLPWFPDGKKTAAIWQYDFPLSFLDWLLQAIKDNELPLDQRPYTTFGRPGEELEGEMLHLMPGHYGGEGGYFIMNESRQERFFNLPGKPTEMDLQNSLLHRDGLMNLFKEAAQKIKGDC